MARFTATGSVTLSGIVFHFEAENIAVAMSKAKFGEFEEYDTTMASLVDWEITSDPIEDK